MAHAASDDSWGVHVNVTREMLRLSALLLVLLVLFGSIERLWPVRRQPLVRQAFGIDVAYYFLSGMLPKFALLLAMSMLAAILHQFDVYQDLYEAVAAWPVALRLGVAVIVGEMGAYWGHRLSHQIPWLWRFHVIHHSSQEIDWLVNTRAHPVDLLFTRLCGYVPLYLLGLAQPSSNSVDLVPLLVSLLGTVWGFFIHANLRWRFGPLEWLVSTPAFHHWHHTLSNHINKNYAAMLPLVDKLFGTLYLPKAWPAKYGTDTPVPDTMAAQLLEPLQPEQASQPLVPHG